MTGVPSESGSRTIGTRRAAPAAPAGPLVSLLVRQMGAAWRRGERTGAEELLARHPRLAESPEAAVRLVYEEVCLRQELGEAVDAAEVLRRFPRWKEQLEVVLECHRLIAAGGPPALPPLDETLEGFDLLAEMGGGGCGRVFLAAEQATAGRPVVLKAMPCDGRGRPALARLQHTHIVPLYWLKDYPERNWRVLCMPHLGGTTLDRLLDELRDRPVAGRAGRDLVTVLVRTQLSSPAALPARGPARSLLGQAPYAEAVAWVGACLAGALHFAHERDLVHLDVRPGHVLLTADGQPMLLDFHLARPPLRPGDRPDWLGGTPAYLSPEQGRAVAALREDRPVPEAVDGRADVYSLGAVLYEALGGTARAAAGGSRPPLHDRNPQVSPGLSDVIHKCLADDPRDRYPDAAALAGDLWRHLNDLPLQGVPNRSLAERWHKWRRRRSARGPRWAPFHGD